MAKELDVYISGIKVGVLSQSASGSLSFSYDRGYRGVPLSSSMPLSTRSYGDKALLPYLWGLLPEDPSARRRVASEYGGSPNNPFSLLAAIGLDCPGAVQFCSGALDTAREEGLVPLTEADVAKRLALGRRGESGWVAENEHWSLGGQQNKFALRRRGGHWCSCEGAAATTHIFKSGVNGLSLQALNEYVCMRLAKACEIDVADVDYQAFSAGEEVETAIIVSRYDRLVHGDEVVRLHQEDLCQALGCLPDNKYTMFGGPGCADVVGLLMETGREAQGNVGGFLQMLFFNYLLAATDAHAKNYSIILDPHGEHRLAPMYDVASMAPYVAAAQWKVKPPKLAMSIGGENRVGRLLPSNIDKLVRQCNLESVGITARGCTNLMALYAEVIPGELATIFDELEDADCAREARELRAHMEEPIAWLCAKTKDAMTE